MSLGLNNENTTIFLHTSFWNFSNMKKLWKNFGKHLYCLLLFNRSVVSDSVNPWTAARQASLSFTISQSLLKLCPLSWWWHPDISVLCRPLLILPSIFPRIRVFSSGSSLHIMWPEYWSFSLSISPSKEYSGLISFRVDWLYLFAVQRTLKSLL